MVMRVAIVGCGLIGQKRMRSLGEHRLVAVADTNAARAEALAAHVRGCRAHTDWQSVVRSPEVDAVIVATTNDALATVTRAALQHGKHVLVEKPAARSMKELAPVASAAQSAGVCVKVGFNHRFHPAFVRARTIVDSGELGSLMYVRGRYGHGGRLGYEREWRADPAISGGGELLDQGVHLIDLARWFLGDFEEVHGHIATFFWNMPVEDNGFLCLTTSAGQVAWLHASCTEWKNTFSFEIFGCHGKLQVDGLGGSYGVERLTHYRMLPQMGPPETTTWEYPDGDQSWSAEFAHFSECISQRRQPSGTLHDALEGLRVVESVYAQCRSAIRENPAMNQRSCHQLRSETCEDRLPRMAL
jgi:predicted dehydrogenase